MRVYRLMFEDKQAEALSKLAKVAKISHVAAAKDLFYEQAIYIPCVLLIRQYIHNLCTFDLHFY
jgi:hypothetical protein